MWATDWVTPAFQDNTFSNYNLYFIQNLRGLTFVDFCTHQILFEYFISFASIWCLQTDPYFI
jgi:hypothetical protein